MNLKICCLSNKVAGLKMFYEDIPFPSNTDLTITFSFISLDIYQLTLLANQLLATLLLSLHPPFHLS